MSEGYSDPFTSLRLGGNASWGGLDPLNDTFSSGDCGLSCGGEKVITEWEVWGYSVVVPTICGVGIVANTLSLVVMTKVNFKESHYVYLKVLSAADLVTVALILLSGLARGVGRGVFWLQFVDVFVHLPVGAFSTTVSIVTLMAVTLERLLVIKLPVSSRQWRTPQTARKICVAIGLFSLVFNLPYCFCFLMQDGLIVASEFSKSEYYNIHNWVRLLLLGILPGVFLLIGNIMFIISLSKYRKNQHFQTNRNGRSNSIPISNMQERTGNNTSKTTAGGPGNTHQSADSVITDGLPAFCGSLSRRFTLGSVSNNEILVQIILSKKTWSTGPVQDECKTHGHWEQSYVIDLTNSELCTSCHRVKDPRVTQQLDSLQCSCKVQRSRSLPCSFLPPCSAIGGSGERDGMLTTLKDIVKSAPPEKGLQKIPEFRTLLQTNSDFSNVSMRSTNERIVPAQRRARQRPRHQRRATLVLVAMICSFLIGEAPTHLASRTTAASFRLPGKAGGPNDIAFRAFKLTVSILMSAHYSGNFFLYLALNRRFARELRQLYSRWRRDRANRITSRSST